MRTCVVAIAVLLLSHASAGGEDRAIISTGSDNSGRRTLVGTIDDFNGKELKLQLASGQAIAVPSERVIELTSAWNADHQQADLLAGQRKYEAAITAYIRANKGETRQWARRRILASVVTCYENLGQIDRAGDTFVLLMKADDHWQYFERIPLAWLSGLAEAGVDQRAAAWLKNDALPPSVLLGASWSLAGPQRVAAVAELRKLANHADPRIAHLADAQLWRANIATVGPQELDAWKAHIERMPAALRAGPYLMLAKGLAVQDTRGLQPVEGTRQAAAWTYMRVPILYPERHALCAAALDGAAGELAKLNATSEALSLYRELVDNYPDNPLSAPATRKLKSLTSEK